MVKLSEMQTLFLWAVLAKGGTSSSIGEIKPLLDKAAREALGGAGLITTAKRGRSLGVEVTDKGWAWAGDNLAAPLPVRSTAGSAILQGWLERLQVFMRARDVRLAEILGPQPAPAAGTDDHAGATAPASPASDRATLRERIRNAYLDVTGGNFNRRALLSNLRRRLPDIDRATLDEVLKRMQHENEASLMRLDNPIDIAETDREAAIQIGSEPRHILWIAR